MNLLSVVTEQQKRLEKLQATVAKLSVVVSANSQALELLETQLGLTEDDSPSVPKFSVETVPEWTVDSPLVMNRPRGLSYLLGGGK